MQSVRGVKSDMLRLPVRLTVVKSAVAPLPSAMLPPAQFPGSLQFPLASAIQVPFAAKASCGVTTVERIPSTTAKKDSRNFLPEPAITGGGWDFFLFCLRSFALAEQNRDRIAFRLSGRIPHFLAFYAA